MTVSTTISRISYAGNGSTTVFSFPYYFLNDADLLVILTVDATGVETTQTITTEYTVTGAGVPAGGNVTMITAPASGETLTIVRDPDPLQPLDLADNDALPAEELEMALDRTAMIVQRALSLNERAFRLAETDTGSAELPTSAARASKYLAFDSNGDPVATAGTAGASDVVISSFMETFVDDTSANAGLTTLGLSANGISLVSAANYAAMRALVTPLTTNGDLWTYTGGVDARLAIGANGTTLRVASGALSYAVVDGWTFAAQYTPSATASQAITDLDQTKDHRFVLRFMLPATDGSILRMRTSPDSGGSPTFDSGASDYSNDLLGRTPATGTNANQSGSTASESTDHIDLTISGSGNVASNEVGATGEILLWNPASTTGDTTVQFWSFHRTNSNAMQYQYGLGARKSAAVVQAVQFYFSSGNITSGTIDHYTRPVQ